MSSGLDYQGRRFGHSRKKSAPMGRPSTKERPGRRIDDFQGWEKHEVPASTPWALFFLGCCADLGEGREKEEEKVDFFSKSPDQIRGFLKGHAEFLSLFKRSMSSALKILKCTHQMSMRTKCWTTNNKRIIFTGLQIALQVLFLRTSSQPQIL